MEEGLPSQLAQRGKTWYLLGTGGELNMIFWGQQVVGGARRGWRPGLCEILTSTKPAEEKMPSKKLEEGGGQSQLVLELHPPFEMQSRWSVNK